MGIADYLLRFTPAAKLETNHYDDSFTVAKIRLIKEALYPRGQTVSKIQKLPSVELVRACI